MRLLRLSLTNWRGVERRELRFACGVTLIEGPNEIGKSTLVEALRMLFNELDSSNKKAVKAVQPVGQDVGSRVEAEVRVGDKRFVYAKTFNKAKQTSLDILAPASRQLTGREAHEAVQELLAESVDMVLWDALLVDQGEKVAPANLQASTGLARALDEAAGAAAGLADDSDLYSAVQVEYEKYFTLKTGKPRFSHEIDEAAAAAAAVIDARRALDEVEEDVDEFERHAGEVRRLRLELPRQRERLAELEQAWQAIGSLQGKLAVKQNEFSAAQTIHAAIAEAEERRHTLCAQIDEQQGQLADKLAAQAPWREQIDALKARLTNAQKALADRRQCLKSAQRAFALAEDDARYLHNLQTLTGEQARLTRLQEMFEGMRTQRCVIGTISIDDAVLDEFRDANQRLEIARGGRAAAATTVSVTALRELLLDVDDVSQTLAPGETRTHTVARELMLRLADVAQFRIVPPQSASELDEQMREEREHLAVLARRHRVADLREAVAAHQRRGDAQRELDRLAARAEDLLAGTTRERIALELVGLRGQCESYLARRVSPSPLPADVAEADRQRQLARPAAARAQDALDVAQHSVQYLREEFERQDNRLRVQEQRLAVLRAGLQEKGERLAAERAAQPDAALAERAARARGQLSVVGTELDTLQESLRAAAPQAAQALLGNAQGVCDRLGKDLQVAESAHAIVTDRLQRAQADGRFETAEQAERQRVACDATLAAVQRRAQGAALLWRTLNRNRNAAREAYVRPLKDAIESLGTIVFGPTFRIEIGEDWSLLARTLHGKTLPFDDLSVGAKEQLGILARLAAARIVSRQGGVPLIIDDALGFADPSRLATMGAAIAEAGKHCQIIILTCTPGRFTSIGSASVVRF